MDWSPQQEDALEAVGEWLDTAQDDQQVFRLFGYAGTGKTTLAQSFAKQCSGQTVFAAYTGKAALVLQRKGCPNAQTIHKLIYIPQGKSQERLRDLKQQENSLKAQVIRLKGLNSSTSEKERQLDIVQLAIRDEQSNLKRPSFTLNLDSDLELADLIIVDEVSMVGKSIGQDLESFRVPILVLGDPAQLPPVKDGGYFTETDPDIMLTEIHRQAGGSPIIEMATTVRTGGDLAYGNYGNSRVLRKGKLSIEEVAAFDQVLVGRNATRKHINEKIRTEVLGRESAVPVEGDKLVCLRNDSEAGMLNGGLWVVDKCDVVDEHRLLLMLHDEDDERRTVQAHRHYFEDREDDLAFYEMREAQSFDFAYALTVHKSQGSQFDNVLVIDESDCFRQHAARWLYTAITRAAKTVTVVR